MTTGNMEEWGIAPDDVKNATEVLKEGRMFLTSLPSGEIPGDNPGELGLYFHDTRFLNSHEIKLAGSKPLLLSGGTRDSHYAQIELTNRELAAGPRILPLQTVHLRISRVLRDSFYQRLRLINFTNCPVDLELGITLGADFLDIFEVRGLLRPCCGKMLEPDVFQRGIRFWYQGLDGKQRLTEVRFSRPPDRVQVNGIQAHMAFTFHQPRPQHGQMCFHAPNHRGKSPVQHGNTHIHHSLPTAI